MNLKTIITAAMLLAATAAHAVKKEFLRPSKHTSECPWKGTAHYYNLEVDGMQNENAAWYYPHPKPAAAEIKDHVAFWKGVRVEA